jgi:cyanate permease
VCSTGLSALGSRGWQVTVLCGALYFGFMFAWNSLAALIPTIADDLALTELETGVVLGTIALTIFLTWSVVGPWVERVGPGRAMLIGTITVAIASAARAYADGYLSLVAAMALLSLGGSTITYGLPSAVASWFVAENAGTPMGIATVGATLGTVVGFETMPTVANELGGWRPALLAASVPALVFGTLWFWLGGLGPHRDGSAPPSVRTVPSLLGRPDIALVVLAGVVYLFATHSVYGWLAPLLMERGLEIEVATRLVAVLTAGQIGGIVMMPYLSDRWSARELVLGISGGTFALGVVSLSILPVHYPSFGIISLLAGVAIGGVSPLLRTLPVERVTSGSVSTVVSMVFGLGALGGFVGPVVIGGVLSQTTGANAAFGVLAAAGVAFIALAALLSRYQPK